VNGYVAKHHPRDRAGTEPRNARSPLRLRLVLAVGASIVTLVAAVVLAVASRGESDPTGLRVAAGICVLVAVVSVVDALQVSRRIGRGDRG